MSSSESDADIGIKTGSNLGPIPEGSENSTTLLEILVKELEANWAVVC